MMKKRYTFHCLLWVLGLISPTLLPGQESASDSPSKLSAESLFARDQLIDVEIELKKEDWDLLRQQSRSMTQALGKELPEKPFSYVPANIKINGQWIEQVGIRKKGFLGSLSEDRPSLKIKFSEYRKQAPIEGLSRLTLNNNQQDPSRLNQRIAYQLFNDVGLTAPRCNLAKVTVNGEYLGIYSNVESIKKPFLARFGDDEGALYEGTVTDFFPDKIARFEAKNSAAEFKDLTKLAKILEEKPLDLEALERRVDIDAFLKFWAVESLIGFWDGYTNNQNNYFVYRNPGNEKFYFIPWGLDSCFTDKMPIPPFNIPHASVHSQAILANQLYQIPEVQARYHETLQNILTEHWDEEALLKQLEEAKSLIQDHVLESQGGFEKDLKRIENFIRTRRQALSKEMNAWPVKITTPPRRPFYFANIGTFEATFDTLWFERTPKTEPPVGKTKITLTMEGEPVELTEMSVYAEPDKNRPAENGQRPPTLVFKGKRQRDGKAMLIGVGLKDEDFRPSKQKDVDVEGILIEGNPLFFFARMAAGRAELTLVSGKVKFQNASRKVDGRVDGSIQLKILKTSEN